MSKLKLTYFDFHGGRGETARLVLHWGAVPFEDNRIKVENWGSLKASTPFGALPVIEVDGQVVAQSNAINRFVAKLANLYPQDALQALFCDEALEASEDISLMIDNTIFLKDEEEKKQRRLALVEGPLSFALKALAGRLAARGGQWFAGGSLSVADLKVFLLVRRLRSGTLDYMDKDLVDRVAPTLVQHLERVRSQPQAQSYYAARGLS